MAAAVGRRRHGYARLDVERASYPPATYARLVAVKDRYDPTNLFRLNQNIRPSVAPDRQR
jgi:FAD/FMN-containing dehydrogenase